MELNMLSERKRRAGALKIEPGAPIFVISSVKKQMNAQQFHHHHHCGFHSLKAGGR